MDLQVFTVVVIKNEIIIPAAVLFTSSKETSTYFKFFQLLKEVSKNKFNPNFVCVDFEKAISDAVLQVWPDAKIVRDLFHLKQANYRWVKKHSSKDRLQSFMNSFSQFYNLARTPESFSAAKDQFLQGWEVFIPGYTEYFHKTWIELYKPAGKIEIF